MTDVIEENNNSIRTTSAYKEHEPKEKGHVEKKLPTLDELKACIPPECFEKNLPKSLMYLLIDYSILYALYQTQPYFELLSYPGLVFWYFLVGMMGFSVFVVGHDCGHTTFSNYTLINDFFGNFTHGMLFVPYWPWQKSHRQHHTFTAHVTKDRGHPWITESRYATWRPMDKFFANNVITSPVRWPAYTIAGIPDGSHFMFTSHMFTTTGDRIKCIVSVLFCFAWATVAYRYFETPHAFTKFYVLPVIAQGFWLIMVTYLQHETDDIEVFEDGTWNFVKGQLQTIDRAYGFGIDYLMHHITDGHVAHHLFFTRIPHYSLMKATAAVREKLKQCGVYREQETYNFLYEFAALNNRLRYLIGEGTGILHYPTRSDLRNSVIAAADAGVDAGANADTIAAAN